MKSLEQFKAEIGITEIKNSLSKPVSQVTINRDLAKLVKNKEISKKGFSRNIAYQVSPYFNLLSELDSKSYFQTPKDKRQIRKITINEIIHQLKDTAVFSPEELKMLEKLKNTYKDNLKKLNDEYLIEEFSRLNREIAHNLNKEQESQIAVNNKSCLNYLWKNSKKIQNISSAKIKKMHSLLQKYLKSDSKLRTKKIEFLKTNYLAPETKFAIKDALKKAVQFINKEDNSFIKAFTSMLLINFIQPLKTQNLKLSQFSTNALLIGNKSFPLCFVTDHQEIENAVMIYLEQQNITPLKEIFIAECKHTVESYFTQVF